MKVLAILTSIFLIASPGVFHEQWYKEAIGNDSDLFAFSEAQKQDSVYW